MFDLSQNESVPRHCRILGISLAGGTVLFFSQFKTVHGLTLRIRAASFCVSPRSCLVCLRCSPKVDGSGSEARGLCAFSVVLTHGKKATRPCPCGYLGDASGRCRCTPEQVARYRGRLSGPLLDRIDLHIEVPRLPECDLLDAMPGEASAKVRERVIAARARQLDRQGRSNADLGTREIDLYCQTDPAAANLLKQAIARLGLSARAYHRILKVARTLADLAGVEALDASHVAEAVQYRRGLMN